MTTTPPHTSRLAVAALAAAGLIALGGCGSDDEGAPIPDATATALEAQLNSIQSRYEAAGPACTDIVEGDDTNVAVVERNVNELPADVDPDVRQALEQSFERLFTLVTEQCDTSAGQETETTETVSPPETDTETAPSETETETVPPDTDPETTPDFPPDTTGPPEDVPGEGNGLDGVPDTGDGGVGTPEGDG